MALSPGLSVLLSQLSPLDWVALGWFVLTWGGYTIIIDHLLERPWGLNQHMKRMREQWFMRMIERQERIIDSGLVGHVIHSVSIFASSTIIVLAALVGLLGALKQAYQILMDLAFAIPTTPELFQLKVLLLIAIFIYGFLRFTWSIRQLNYACALIGAAPLPPVEPAVKKHYARHLAQVLSLGMASFNGGLRSYYFGLAALGWFVHPWLFITLTTVMLLVLLRRQLLSRTYRAIHELSTGE
jgi:uncharacterized membrane protein